MAKPLVGITSFSLEVPCSRSAVNQQYVDAIVAAGGAPICIPVGLDEESIERVYGVLDALLLPGGDDVAPDRYGEEQHASLGPVDEARDQLELSLATRALKDNLPVLGICRGIQLLAVAAGGTLYQDIPSQRASNIRHEVREFGRDHLAHSLTLKSSSRLAAAMGCTTARVNSFHHQAVRDVPPGFVVTAESEDGLVEAIESSARRFAVAVQCHPEEMWSTSAPEFGKLFEAFVDSARETPVALRA